MSDLQKIMDAPITPLPDTTIRAALACVRRCCPADVAEIVEQALGLRP